MDNTLNSYTEMLHFFWPTDFNYFQYLKFFVQAYRFSCFTSTEVGNITNMWFLTDINTNNYFKMVDF